MTRLLDNPPRAASLKAALDQLEPLPPAPLVMQEERQVQWEQGAHNRGDDEPAARGFQN